MKQHVISDHNLETVQRWAGEVSEHVDHLESTIPSRPEPSTEMDWAYYSGAEAAFNDVLLLIPPTKKELKEKTPINGRGLTITLVTVGTVGAITYRKEIKAGIQKLKAKFRG